MELGTPLPDRATKGAPLMPETMRIPRTVSLYEVVRTHPEAANRLSSAGIGPEFLDHRLVDAAKEIGVPVDRLAGLLELERD